MLSEAIDLAGGYACVAYCCKVDMLDVRGWMKEGLPRSEWSCETRYGFAIAAMQDKYTEEDLLRNCTKLTISGRHRRRFRELAKEAKCP